MGVGTNWPYPPKSDNDTATLSEPAGTATISDTREQCIGWVTATRTVPDEARGRGAVKSLET